MVGRASGVTLVSASGSQLLYRVLALNRDLASSSVLTDPLYLQAVATIVATPESWVRYVDPTAAINLLCRCFTARFVDPHIEFREMIIE